MHYAESLQNPLGPKVNFKFIEKEAFSNGEKQGTYGVIAGAKLYVGIAICHFHLAVLEMGLAGRFEKQNVSDINLPSNMKYVISWRID